MGKRRTKNRRPEPAEPRRMFLPIAPIDMLTNLPVRRLLTTWRERGWLR